MDFHIGRIINEVREKRGVSTSGLAKKVNRSREALYDIYKKNTVDTELLKAISEALQYNFFIDLANQPMLIDNFVPGSVMIGSNIVNEPTATYDANYKEKYFTVLEKLMLCQEEKAELQQKLNSGSLEEMLQAVALRNEAFQELMMDYLAQQQNTSIDAVHAALGIKLTSLWQAEKQKDIQTD